MYQVLAYIKFLLNSTNQHGVHSPFVYDFITKCLYDHKSYNSYETIESYRNALIRNNDVIDITEFGAGSRVFKSNKRTTSAIVKHSGMPLKRAKLFYRIIKYFNTKSILELGTSLGITTHAMALANPESKIISIEGCPNISLYTKQLLYKIYQDTIEIKTGEFEKILPQLNSKKFDLIFFDGHHNKEATIQYFETLLPKAQNDSVFIFDDIYWSKGMTEAWEYIKAHKSVAVTIDTFYLGFVFFRKEQAKEHFKIRM